MISEKSLRRLADNVGLRLRKLRGREDEYILTSVESGGLIFPWEYGQIGYGASLEEIEAHLS